MKSMMRGVFSFLLTPLEAGTEPFSYKPSHRWALKGMGGLFCLLAAVVLYLAIGNPLASLGHYLPAVIFGSVGLLALVVGFVGSDRAVAKVWGSR